LFIYAQTYQETA